MRRRQINVSLEKSPKDPLDELEPKMTTDEKLQVVERLGTGLIVLYAAKVSIDAVGTIAVNLALKGIK